MLQKYLISIICFLTLAININAAETATITGKIVTAEDNSPLASATIVLHNAKDSSTATGAIADKAGSFTLNATIGNYYLEVKFVGYVSKYIDIKVQNTTTQNVGTIKLVQTELLQNEVVVEAEKEAVVLGIDSKTFNVTKDLTAGGTNILDVLRKIPSVNVDLDENITMNGSTPKILVDGRESNYSSKEMLKVLSSDLVESVELITNPSAKYESEGVSGIIDIKLKKEIDNGFNGMVNVWGGSDFEFKYGENGGGGFYGNYKLGKVNLFGNLSYNHYGSNSDDRSNRTTWIDGDTAYTDRFGNYEYNSNWYGGKLGADIEFTKKDVLTLSVNASGGGSDFTSLSRYNSTDALHNPTEHYDYTANSDGENFDGNIAANYKKSFEEKGHNLYVDAYISKNKGDDDGSNSRLYEPINEGDALRSDLFKDDSHDNTYREVVQVDYEKTLELFGNLGAGVKAVYRQISNDETEFRFNHSLGEYLLDPTLSDSYKFSDGILSAYFTLGKKWESFSYRLGLRAEYTDWDFRSNVMDTSFNDNYLSIIPTVHLKYNFGITHSFSISYSRRLQRPWYSELNPFERIIDSNSIWLGNPDLVPSYYNSYSFDYMFFTPKTTVTTSLFYRNTDNTSEYYHSLTPWGGIRSYPMNIAKNTSYGASITLNQTITDWWNLNAYFSLNNQMYEALDYGIEKREQTNWSVSMNTTLKLMDNLRLQLSGYYSPSSISLQGRYSGYYAVNAGLHYDFFDDRMSAGLNLNNLIFPNNNEFITFGDYFNSYSYYNWQHRQFSLRLSYKINDYKQKQERNLDDGSGGGGAPQGGGQGGI
ncbi:MAG: TonB-dependent receptor family protein [Ignavibacteria bacterium]|jgi:outer membrane receptor protein involved in Fe transport|nr:TonB-dependent receptor family protein [Ignavibacteria bacterium]